MPNMLQAADAMSHVAGYTVAHDVTARDWMRRNGRQCLLGKSFDTFCPLGPVMVTTAALSGRIDEFRGLNMYVLFPFFRPPQLGDQMSVEWEDCPRLKHEPTGAQN